MGGKIRLGMIGTGFIGQLAHLMNYVEIPECEVLAIAEFKPILRREVATRFNVPRQYVTADELLADPDIDAVCVVTPRPHTGPTVLRCLEAGKHVISEKPMAGSVVDAERLVAAAKANNVRYVVGYMKRYDEGVQKGKAILDDALKSGELGEITYVRAHCFTGDSYCNPWGHVITEEQPNYSDDGWEMAPRWLPEDWKKAFHVYLNTYSHNTNLLRYLFGRTPDVVSANVARANGQVAILNFGEFLGTLETGIASNRDWDEVTEIFFTDGRITIKTPPALMRNLPAKVEIYYGGDRQEVRSPLAYWSWSFRRQADAFIEDLLKSRDSISPCEDALEELKLIEAIWACDPIIRNILDTAV